MARKRVITPTFWTDDNILELDYVARLLFIGLWNFCDDIGIHKNNEKVLKAEVFPADTITIEEIRSYLDQLIGIGLLLVSEDNKLLKVKNWTEYQKINHKTPSKYEQMDITFKDQSGTINGGVIPNIIQYNTIKDNINKNNDSSTTKKKSVMKPKPYKERVNEWYESFKSDPKQKKRFKETFPDVDIDQKLLECRSWLLTNVRKNYDKVFFNWCSNHTGRKQQYKNPLDEEIAQRHKNQQRLDMQRRKKEKELIANAASDDEIQDIMGDIRNKLKNKYQWRDNGKQSKE